MIHSSWKLNFFEIYRGNSQTLQTLSSYLMSLLAFCLREVRILSLAHDLNNSIHFWHIKRRLGVAVGDRLHYRTSQRREALGNFPSIFIYWTSFSKNWHCFNFTYLSKEFFRKNQFIKTADWGSSVAMENDLWNEISTVMTWDTTSNTGTSPLLLNSTSDWLDSGTMNGSSSTVPSMNGGDVELDLSVIERFRSNRRVNDGAFFCLIAAYCVLIVFGTLGNSLVVYVVARQPAMRTPRNIFVVNLAVSDLLLCLITMPLTVRLRPALVHSTHHFDWIVTKTGHWDLFLSFLSWVKVK